MMNVEVSARADYLKQRFANGITSIFGVPCSTFDIQRDIAQFNCNSRHAQVSRSSRITSERPYCDASFKRSGISFV